MFHYTSFIGVINIQINNINTCGKPIVFTTNINNTTLHFVTHLNWLYHFYFAVEERDITLTLCENNNPGNTEIF